MAGVDIEKYKRIVQYFWDPEPKNDTAPEASIWCLGQEYTSHSPHCDNPSPGTMQIPCQDGCHPHDSPLNYMQKNNKSHRRKPNT